MRRLAPGLVLAAAVGLAGCTPGPGVEDYAAKIAEARAEKDAAFQSSPDSPIPPDKKNVLLPLAYYPIDEMYAVPAELEMSRDRSRLQIPTSTGKLRDYERIGTLRFSLKGTVTQLTAFSEVGQPLSRLFVPFADETSGTETYAAGRYLELDPTVTGIYVIDFNGAYHPFCYYNTGYDCPYPPAENRLAVPIRAGERLPETPRAAR
ncbi:MAG TPA: DUF1684 domain-containing protein [Vicinamibacterales bacterium]|nr:DUF1684 domain-containing protein [Vicinamibacterales bacterium]